MENLNIEAIIQGGAVGIAIFLIILIGFIIRKIFGFMSNHINTNTEALTKNTETLEDLKEAIKELKNYLCRVNGK